MNTLHPSPQWDEPVTSVSPIDVVDKISTKTRIGLAVGDKDDTTPPDLTERYAAALRKHGIEPNVTVLPGRNHVIIFDNAVMQELSQLIAQLH
jgi:dipeptidyl aminopeptidase/acylaminoacyl peptidase